MIVCSLINGKPSLVSSFLSIGHNVSLQQMKKIEKKAMFGKSQKGFAATRCECAVRKRGIEKVNVFAELGAEYEPLWKKHICYISLSGKVLHEVAVQDDANETVITHQRTAESTDT